jgi:hypothetical protein
VEDCAQTLKAVIFFDRGWWVAQCLDYDICVSAKSRERLPRKLLRRLQSRAGFDLSRGLSPFQNASKAPDKFWTMYAAATPFEVQELREPWFIRLWSFRPRPSRLRAELAFGLGIIHTNPA